VSVLSAFFHLLNINGGVIQREREIKYNLSIKKFGDFQRPYIYIDLRRGPPVRLAWREADCNTLGGGKTGYLK
jgi:hypothetical protein